MTPLDDIALTPDDIARDLAASDAAKSILDDFFAEADAFRPPPRTRGSSSPSGVGRILIGRCPAATQKRYYTLLRFEASADDTDDHGLLITPACAVLEGELCRLVAQPVRVNPALLAALTDLADSSRRVLENWQHGQPATLGTLHVLFLAIRRGLERNQPFVVNFVAERFRPEFTAMLRDRRLAITLNRIREHFRNPAGHGTRNFDPAAYEECVNLLVAARRFDKWDRTGPELAPPSADAGILHHHLTHALSG